MIKKYFFNQKGVKLGFSVFFILLVSSCNKNPSIQYKKINQLETFTYLSGEHKLETFKYKESPPVGGQHNPFWQNCGVYSKPQILENIVHSLEHGAIWITYTPSLTASKINKLEQFAKNLQYIIVSPYPNTKLIYPIYIVAWNKRLGLKSENDSRIKEFIKQFRIDPINTPEFGAPCTNGVGNPNS